MRKNKLLKLLFDEYLQYMLDRGFNDMMDIFVSNLIGREPFDMFRFRFIESKFLTHKNISHAVRKDGRVLQFIDDSARTPEIIIESVKNHGEALKYIKDTEVEKMMRPEIYIKLVCAAVRTNGFAIQYVKKLAMPLEIYIRLVLLAVRYHGSC